MNRFFSTSPLRQQQGIALVRIIVGLFLIYHGSEVFNSAKIKDYAGWDTWKHYPSPTFLVYFGKASEFVGGVLLTLGLFTRLACIIICGTMLFIVFFIGNGKIWSDDQYPFLFVLLALIFFFTGPGKWNLDRFIFKNNSGRNNN